MYFEEELVNITEGVCTEELLNKILRAYLQEMKSDGMDIKKDYRESKQVLETLLDENQKNKLSMMERLYRENMRYCIGFGFRRGIYAGFQQFFVKDSTKEAFREFVVDQIVEMPNMKKYTEYYERQNEINRIYDSITEGLNEQDIEYVTTVYSIFDNETYNVLRYAFYLGYRYALSILKDTEGIMTVMDITDKILYTEHELDFTRTYEERQNREYHYETKK